MSVSVLAAIFDLRLTPTSRGFHVNSVAVLGHINALIAFGIALLLWDAEESAARSVVQDLERQVWWSRVLPASLGDLRCCQTVRYSMRMIKKPRFTIRYSTSFSHCLDKFDVHLLLLALYEHALNKLSTTARVHLNISSSSEHTRVTISTSPEFIRTSKGVQRTRVPVKNQTCSKSSCESEHRWFV